MTGAQWHELSNFVQKSCPILRSKLTKNAGLIYIRAATAGKAGKAGKVWYFLDFGFQYTNNRKQPVKIFLSRILDLACLTQISILFPWPTLSSYQQLVWLYCHNSTIIASVRLWKFKDDGSQKARFLQCGDQVSRISFDFLKWRSTGPQKLTKLSFQILKFWKFRKQIIFFCKNLSDFVP